jgi:hypothetical protein
VKDYEQIGNHANRVTHLGPTAWEEQIASIDSVEFVSCLDFL